VEKKVTDPPVPPTPEQRDNQRGRDGSAAAIPDYCSYEVDLYARELGNDPSEGATGWGYGVGLCSTVSNNIPVGLSIQNNFDSSYSGISVFSQVVLPSPDQSYGPPINYQIPADTQWHHWMLRVKDDSLTVTYDHHVVIKREGMSGASPLPESCQASGLVIRVWGGTAQFKDPQLRRL
jgi:hypothetical protein